MNSGLFVDALTLRENGIEGNIEQMLLIQSSG
jgi:hypothetical protein